MYLKTLEMIGFKSFAEKTRLEFEPGLTAIVGPNGCGKSNISDALRWVLGEQSAKALRGAKMEDCIFNGTDARKPLGMAEVSISFADCEKTLGTEYHEVTVTRRVFRSGEGQYFLNKTPCRLKDIQRLFMDTGIGTHSYSLMEQGRIDQVLSAHPEDRREIFEEASGITKFKADKNEAIRKLDQTEANLLRLADVIREVKRQIGSLQRQAGKARRYKEIRDELRKLDLYATRQRTDAAAEVVQRVEAEIAGLTGRLNAAHADVEEMEHGNAVLRESLVQTEREIGTLLEAGMQAQNKLDHARELIQVNRQRIAEYRALSERDGREIDETGRQLADRRQESALCDQQIDQARGDEESASAKLKVSAAALTRHREEADLLRIRIQKLRSDSVDLESLHVRLQNELAEMESRERSNVIQRERLSAEKAQLGRVASGYDKRQAEMQAALDHMLADVDACKAAQHSLESQKTAFEKDIRSHEQELAALQATTAARQAQIDLLSDEEESRGDFPGGSRRLLNGGELPGVDSSRVLGALASWLDVEPEYATALEAALRPWIDAVVVSDTRSAREVLARLEAARSGAARLVAADLRAETEAAGPEGLGTPLLLHVKCADAVRSVVGRLLGNVYVVDSLDAVPSPLPPACVFVTRHGSLMRGDGCMEFWMRDTQAFNPLSRKNMLAEARGDLSAGQALIAEKETVAAQGRRALQEIDAALATARVRLEDSRRTQAQKEGETQIVCREATEARQRMETVAWELDTLISQGAAGDSERKAILAKMADVQSQRAQTAAGIHAETGTLQQLEARHSALQAEVTEDRIALAGLTQRVEHLTQQQTATRMRVAEMEASLKGRAEGVQSYRTAIERLEADIAAAEGQLASMEEAVRSNHVKADNLKRNRENKSQELKDMERLLGEKREVLEQLREARSALEIRCSETRMRRQNQIERVNSEYHITLEQMLAEPEPQWETEPPSMDALETQVAELRTKLDAMGPVNLVAIEEYKELEERFLFLTGQEQDLVNSKQQLMDMIRKINLTTSEMFRSTFEQVNANFQMMFARLFNGGQARLVLVNEEDVLECGIEIIARPPGKRLQNVSLLSGGERTLTAVALLFAIYMIKPSAFCLLDELDAALDESNIGRFVNILKDFLAQSQFVVITHNRQTIAAADILYGVTMPEKGISNIVSMRFMDRKPPAGQTGPDAAPAPPETAVPAAVTTYVAK